MSISWSSDWWWWIALLVQLLAIPGTLLPLLPGLIWLPVGGLIWTVAVGWQQAWPELVVALVLFGLGPPGSMLTCMNGNMSELRKYCRFAPPSVWTQH